MKSENPETETTGTTKGKATVQPAATWPSYEDDIAQAEIAAMRMICDHVPLRVVKLRTKLSVSHVRRLADLIAEESRNPKQPRNVCRRPRRAARIRVVQPPARGTARESAVAEQLSLPPSTADSAPAPPVEQDTEPEQLSLLCI